MLFEWQVTQTPLHSCKVGCGLFVAMYVLSFGLTQRLIWNCLMLVFQGAVVFPFNLIIAKEDGALVLVASTLTILLAVMADLRKAADERLLRESNQHNPPTRPGRIE